MSNSLISHEIQSFCAVNIPRFFADEEFIFGAASTIHGREVCRSAKKVGTMRSKEGILVLTSKI